MAYPNRGLLKAAMGHYLTESARTALEALEPGEGMVEVCAGWERGQGALLKLRGRVSLWLKAAGPGMQTQHLSMGGPRLFRTTPTLHRS